MKYFLDVEGNKIKKGILLFLIKYILDLLANARTYVDRICSTLMIPNMHLMKDDGDPFNHPQRYRRIVRKLNYLTVTYLDIFFL